MALTKITDFGSSKKECKKICGTDVEAFIQLGYDENSPENLAIFSTWGWSSIDLSPIVKAGETVTTMFLTPEGAPKALQYNREDGTYDCILGDDLSRIISMHLLADVDQSQTLKAGDVYMWNIDGIFRPYSLQNFITETGNNFQNVNTTIQNLTNRVEILESQLNDVIQRLSLLENDYNLFKTSVQNQLTTINDRLDAIEAKLTPPAGVPSNTRIAWGNINVLGDYSNTNSTQSGIYTHNPNSPVTNDQYFS